MSGGGHGYLDLVRFTSFTPNIGPHMGFKGNTDLPISCGTSLLKCKQGVVRYPTNAGFCIEIDGLDEFDFKEPAVKLLMK